MSDRRCPACGTPQGGHDSLLAQLDRGIRFPNHPELIKGEKHLRRNRDPSAERFPLAHGFAGLTSSPPSVLFIPPLARCQRIAFALWDELDWLVLECWEKPFAGDVFVPVSGGATMQYLYSRHIRAVMGWNQSFLNGVSHQLPGLDKLPGREVRVHTLPFLEKIGHHEYPFMMRHHYRFVTAERFKSLNAALSAPKR